MLASSRVFAGALTVLALSAPSAQAQRGNRSALSYGFDSGVVAIDVRDSARVAIAVARGDSALTLVFGAEAARRWADSSRRLLTRGRTRRGHVLVQRSTMEEVRNSGAALSLVRHASDSDSRVELFLSNRNFGGFPLPLDKREAGILLDAVERAAKAAVPRSKKPRSPRER